MIDSVRKWLRVVVTVISGSTVASGLEAAEVQLATDLNREGRQAEAACVPLLLEFAAVHCGYCTLLEEEILKPTLLNRDYDHRVLIRKLLIDRSTKLRDFNNQLVSAGELASRYEVFVTPTLLLLDRQGRELAERIVGVTTLELFGGYLDRAIDASRDELRRLGRCR